MNIVSNKCFWMGMPFFRDTLEEQDNAIHFRLPRIKQKHKKKTVSLTFDARHHSVNRKI